MSQSRAVSRIWDATPPSLQLLLFGLLVTLLGCVSAVIRPETGATGLWWPAAGIAVAGLILARPRQRVPLVTVLVLAGTLSNLFAGRSLLAAVLLALVNTLGAIVVTVVLRHRRPDPLAFHNLTDLLRLLAAVMVGSLTGGATAGAVELALLGGSFVDTSAAVAASHASSVLLVLPFFLRTVAAPVEAARTELLAQWLATVTVTAFVCAAGQTRPLAFLLLPVLLWPALRSSVRVTALHLLTVGLLCSVLSLRGGGPFAAAVSSAAATSGAATTDRVTIVLVQALVITSAAVMLAVLVTVSQRRALLLDISRREELFRSGFNESLLGQVLLRADDDGLRIIELNGVAARLLGGRVAGLIGTLWGAHLGPADRERMAVAVAGMAAGAEAGWHGEVCLTPQGEERWVEMSVSPAVEAPAGGHLLTMQMVDVTARREAQARLADLALHDGLTGLANRVLLDDRLRQAVAEAGRTGLRLCVMFLDLDDFKAINDTHGHAAGDEVLVEVGRRLLGAVRDTDTVARIGGDEFVILFPNVETAAALDELQHRVQAAVSAPTAIGATNHRLAASIGVAKGGAGSDPQSLLSQADADMYVRKAAARMTPVG